MTDSDKAFVKEVIRIIKEASQCRFGEKTIVLVSNRFFHLAFELILADHKHISGYEGNEQTDCLLVDGMTACKAQWLRDYEFEIRSRCEHMITEKSK